ncbi:MAG TPA: addiction module protein [Flavobacterium sp.]|nr:addiction module protein [Flavobacterium sp.]
MSTTINLRTKVLDYISSADDRLLRMIQTLAENYQEKEKSVLTKAQKDELDRRLERYERGETKFYTWEETKAKIVKAS